jgi:hypothetical protein
VRDTGWVIPARPKLQWRFFGLDLMVYEKTSDCGILLGQGAK